MEKNDAYRILGLANSASTDDIKAAYRAMAQKYSTDTYAVSPMKEEAEAKMADIDAAFDLLMGSIRTGDTAQSRTGSNNNSNLYSVIRQKITAGNIDEALAQLGTVQDGASNAEWNFLMGSAYYYKGWMQQAMSYFNAAVSLDPNNREYAAALNNLRNNANGNMNNSNPYGNNPYGGQAAGCSCCDMCTAMMCMNMCCNCGRGGC